VSPTCKNAAGMSANHGKVAQVTRQQEALALADELIADIDLSRGSVPKHLLKARRLARLIGDEDAQRWIGYEIEGVPDTFGGNEWMWEAGRWTDRKKDQGYRVPASDLEATRAGAEAARAALAGISLSGDSLIPVMRDHTATIHSYTSEATHMSRILGAVDAQVYRYASDVYAELQFSEIQVSLFEESQTAVDATYAAMAGSALKKIESINDRLGTNDDEAISQAMTTCRRLIDAVADHVFPARDEPYDLNGQKRDVKQNNVLNRINAHVHTVGVAGGRATRLRRSLEDIYGRVSKGVHDDVDGHEARYLFLTTYVTLGEVLTLSGSQEG
jgi:AbiTii